MSKEKLKKLTTKIQTPKSNHGITLIALIITIVVMLILVGVTLSIALGENGVISTAKEAKEKTEIAAEKEKLQNAVFATIGNNGEVNLEDIVLPEGFTEVEGSVSYASKVIYQGPSGQQYQVDKVTGKITEVDGANAVEPDDLKDGYKVTYGDYEYTYSSSSQGWSVAVLDKTKEEYGEIATAIYGKPIISLNSTFNNCTNMKVAPEIPEGVTKLEYTFYNCSSLTVAPKLSEGVTGLSWTFGNCTSLTTAPKLPTTVISMWATFGHCSSLIEAPEIPNGVTNMAVTFGGCTSLKIIPEIPSSVTNMEGTFNGCSSLVEAPIIPSGVTKMNNTFEKCTSLTKAPKIPEGVTNLGYTFMDCISLTTAPEIPNGVTNMNATFGNCYKLQGEITINASPTSYSICFNGAGTEGEGIILKGSSTVLNELAATNTQGKVTVAN